MTHNLRIKVRFGLRMWPDCCMESSYKWVHFEHARHKNVSLIDKERSPFWPQRKRDWKRHKWVWMSITHPVQHWIAEITWRHVQIRRNFLYGFLANLGAPNLPPFSIPTGDSYHLTWSPGKTRRPWRRGCLPLNHGILITYFISFQVMDIWHPQPSLVEYSVFSTR